MRVAACGFLIGSTTLASLPTSLFIQGGALAILGWAVWYLLAKAIPSILKSAREERALFLEAQQSLTRSLDMLTTAIIKKE